MAQNEIQLVILGGVIAASAGVLSQVIAQYFNRSNHISDLKRSKAEQLALALADIHRATKEVILDPAGRVDDLLVDRNSVREIEVVARLYFPEIDVSSFVESSTEAITLAKTLAESESLPDEDWPRFTSAVMTFGIEADNLLTKISSIVQSET